MGRFVVSQRDVLRLLRSHGFQQTSQRGSHQYWEKPGYGYKVTVDVKYQEYSGWLLLQMIRQSGLSKSAFRSS
jgi:predicted RNA binding protein YcfA (HicA-like mRNA interferase family)